MSRSKRLQVIQTLADREEAITSRKVADKLFDLQVEEQRLEQLSTYLDEYRALASNDPDVADIATIRARREFVERLQICVQQQRDLVESLCEQLETQMEEWNTTRSKSKSIQRFNERQADEMRDTEARKEQATLDEIGRLQFLNQS